MAHQATDIAKVFLMLSNPEQGDIISNLKLQKLLYYAQGLHVAMYQTPLFEEDLKAWQYGPVVEEVYREFKKFGSDAIPKPTDFNFDFLQPAQKELIEEVNQVFGQFSATKLMEMTHSESPWKNTPINTVISHALLNAYFSTLLTHDEA
jgi:uncharacterized phage-associated protein